MSEHPQRCPFCSNTILSPVDDVRWACLGTLGCGGIWDPAVVKAAPPRLERAEEDEQAAKPLGLRPAHRLLRRKPFRLTDAA